MKLSLRIAISLVLIVLLFSYVVDARQVLRIMRDLQPGYLFLAILIVLLDRALMTYKWTLLLKAQGYRLSLLPGMTLYCAAMLWGLMLPATVGADAIRAVLVMKRGVSGADAVASIVVERMIGFVCALLVGIVSLLVLRYTEMLGSEYDGALYLGMAVLAGTLGALALSLDTAMTGRMVGLLPARVRESKLMQRLGQLADAYRALGAARRTLAGFGALTLLEQVFFVTFTWAVARGLEVEVDALVLLGVVPITMLISRLPISLDGLGIFEAAFVGLLLLAGVPAESSLAIAIASRIVLIVCFLPWWLAQVVSSGGRVRPPQLSSASDPSQS